MSLRFAIVTLFLALIAISHCGCSDKPSPKQPASDVPTKSTLSDTAYSSPLSEGIDFTKVEYPAFVADIQGISGPEPWGRWTDGDRAIIKFKENLPRAFYLELAVKWAFGPNFKRPIRVRVGTHEQTFTVTQTNEIFRFEFINVQNANTIEIIPPSPISPKSMNMNNDQRRVGVGLVKLRVIVKRETG